MNPIAQKLHNYLCDIIENPSTAKLDKSEIPADFRDLAVLMQALQSSLNHLTWQVQQIAMGDYSHRVDFLFDFSDAFNAVVQESADRRDMLEADLAQIQLKNTAIEQFGMLISSLIQYIPQKIIVLDKENDAILFMNEMAILEMHLDFEYLDNVKRLMAEQPMSSSGTESQISYYSATGIKRYFNVRAYELDWEGRPASLYSISDVTETKEEIKELEHHAYRDSLTNLFNRNYGMKILEEWIEKKKPFTLLFADLDKLKYINDTFGHHEGDMYIINAAKHLLSFPSESVVCRLGGDEYMVLIPGLPYEEVESRAARIYDALSTEPYLADKEFEYSMSFGFVSVCADNTLPSRMILAEADERMYENKRARKKARL